MDAIYSVQKMADVLEAGPDTERDFILFELQQLLTHCRGDTLRILVPVLCAVVPSWTPELQIKAAQRLLDVAALPLEAGLASQMALAALQVVDGALAAGGVPPGAPGAAAVAAAATVGGASAPPPAGREDVEDLLALWGTVLVDVLPSVTWGDGALPRLIERVDTHTVSVAYEARKLAARVLGALAGCIPPPAVETTLLPRAVRLASDAHVEVRGTVTESLAFIGAVLPGPVVEARVWPLLARQLDGGGPTGRGEEDVRIRATSVRTLAHVVAAHQARGDGADGGYAGASASTLGTSSHGGGSSGTTTSRLFGELLPPVFSRLCAFTRRFAAEDLRLVDDDTYLMLEVVSQVYGQLLYALPAASRRSVRKDAYKAFLGMATCNGPLVRRNSAYNLPGVAVALGDRLAPELSGLAEYLSKDTDEEVRWMLAGGLHETTARLVAKGDWDRLFAAACALLADENAAIRTHALAHLPGTAAAGGGAPPVRERLGRRRIGCRGGRSRCRCCCSSSSGWGHPTTLFGDGRFGQHWLVVGRTSAYRDRDADAQAGAPLFPPRHPC